MPTLKALTAKANVHFIDSRSLRLSHTLTSTIFILTPKLQWTRRSCSTLPREESCVLAMEVALCALHGGVSRTCTTKNETTIVCPRIMPRVCATIRCASKTRLLSEYQDLHILSQRFGYMPSTKTCCCCALGIVRLGYMQNLKLGYVPSIKT